MERIFEHPTGEKSKWRELVLIDEEKDKIKFYSQATELGFPFSEYETSLKGFGYTSADDFYKTISEREKHNLGYIKITELEVREQKAKEVAGLLNLAKYRNDNGSYESIIKHDGTLSNDIIDRLATYIAQEEAVSLVHLKLTYGIERHCVKVCLENNDSFNAKINGTVEEIKQHYMERKWCIGGADKEDCKKCIRVEFIY